MCKPQSSILRMYTFLILLFIWNVAKADECLWQELDDECSKNCYITLKPVEAFASSVRTTEESLQEQRNMTEKCQNEKIQLSEELASTKSLQSQLVARSSLENMESKLQNMENQLRQLVARSSLENMESKLQNMENQLRQLGARSSLENVESKLQNMENQLRQVEGIVETCRASIKATEETLMQQRKFKKIGQKYYHIENNEKLTWFSALQRCAEWGGHLVHLKSEEEWNLVTKKLSKGHRYWVDFNDFETENTFISATTGEKLTFNKWYPGEPNDLNKKEFCVEVGNKRSFTMNDSYCFAKKNFICQSSNERVFNYN